MDRDARDAREHREWKCATTSAASTSVSTTAAVTVSRDVLDHNTIVVAGNDDAIWVQ